MIQYVLFTLFVLSTSQSLLRTQTAETAEISKTTTTTTDHITTAAAANLHLNHPIHHKIIGDYTCQGNIITIRKSRRYTNNNHHHNIDLSQNGLWFSASPTIPISIAIASNSIVSFTIFASAPTLMSTYVGETIRINTATNTFTLLNYSFQRIYQNHPLQLEPVPKCYPNRRDASDAFSDPDRSNTPTSNSKYIKYIPGSWINRPVSSIAKYGQSNIWSTWESNACYAEQAVHSCFFQNESIRASTVGRRIWQPSSCALLPFNSKTLLKKLSKSHKTLWFEGDSSSIQMFVSLLCLLAGNEVNTGDLHWYDASRNWNVSE